MQKTTTLSVVMLAALLAACNTVPERNNMLEQTRSHLRSAQQNSQVRSLAPDELRRATESFSQAEIADKKGISADEVNHLTYLADQRVSIAEETAKSHVAQATVAGAGAERDKMILAQRTQEAYTAKAQLAASQNRAQDGKARINELEQELNAMGAKKTNQGMVVTLGGVLFYTAQDRLLLADRADMRKLVGFFKRDPQRTAVIEGNADSIGSAASNVALSQRRADSVKAALVALGVDADRLRTRANGEDNPVATNATAAGRQMNRRVEVIFPTS